MKAKFSALLLPILIGIAACARSEPVEADPDEIEAAVEEANQQAAAINQNKGTP